MPTSTAGNLPTATTGALVEGDYVEYVGSLTQYHGMSFAVTRRTPETDALVLASLAEGDMTYAYRYEITRVDVGTLSNVRRQSLRLLGV